MTGAAAALRRTLTCERALAPRNRQRSFPNRDLTERVQQFESWKTGEVTIGAGQRGAMFDCERCQMCVHDQLSRSLALYQNAPQNFPVPLGGLKQREPLASEPTGDYLCRLQGREWSLKNARVSGEPKEGKYYSPGECRQVRAGKRSFQPDACSGVVGRGIVANIKEQVSVD